MSLEPIDEIYKTNFESHQVPYNEAAWLQMQKALKPSGTWSVVKVHIFKWYSILPTAGLVSATLIYLALSLNYNKSNIASVKQLPSRDAIKNNISTIHYVISDNSSSPYSVKSDLTKDNGDRNFNQSNASIANLYDNKSALLNGSSSDMDLSKTAQNKTTTGSDFLMKIAHVGGKTDLPIQHSNFNGNQNEQFNAYDQTHQQSTVDLEQENQIRKAYTLQTMVSTLPFSYLVLNSSDDRNAYLPFTKPNGIKKFMVTASAGLAIMKAKNGFIAKDGNETSISLSRLNKHFIYSIGLGRYAFDQSKSTLTDSTYVTVQKFPGMIYYQRTLDTVIPIVYHHKIINDSIWHYIKTIGTKDSIIYKNTLVSKQIASNLRFIEVPISLAYRINAGRWHFDVEAGTSFLINQSKSYKYYLPEGGYSIIKPYNGFSLNGSLNMGYNFGTHLGAMIYGKYRFGSTFDALPNGDKIMWNAYSGGLGLYYRF